MVLRITVDDFSYEQNAYGYEAPVTDGLLGWWFFGGSLETSIRNLAEGGVGDPDVVGLPSFSDSYASFVGLTSAFELPVIDPVAGTYLAIARSTSTNDASARRPIFIGNFNGGTDYGASLYTWSATQLQSTVGVSNNGGSTVSAHNRPLTMTPTDWSFLACDFDDTGNAIRNLTLGTVAQANHTAGYTRAQGSKHIRIGSGHATYGGNCDIAFAAIYNRRLSSPEIALIYSRLQPFFTEKGLSI